MMKTIVPVCVASGVSSSWQTLWTIAHQALLSMGFSRQEYWSGLPCSSPGGLPYPGIEPQCPMAPALQTYSLLLGHQGSPIPEEVRTPFIVSASSRALVQKLGCSDMQNLSFPAESKLHGCTRCAFILQIQPRAQHLYAQYIFLE